MSKNNSLNHFHIAEPCSEEWDSMTGNDRVRFCSHCAKDVNNISTMTRRSARRLVQTSGGKLCIRYIAHPKTRRPIFAAPLTQITRRVPGLAAGAVSTSIALSTGVFAQGEVAALPVVIPSVSGESVPGGHRRIPEAGGSGKVFGTVVDPMGAVIPNAKVTVTSIDGRKETVSDENGDYIFHGLASRKYSLEITSPGFKSFSRTIDLDRRDEAGGDVSLEVEGPSVEVEIKMDVDLTVAVAGGIGIVEYDTDLARAIASEEIDEVRRLISLGADVNEKVDKETRETPIFVAVETGNIEIVTMLLDAGAKATATTSAKQTPLMRLDSDTTPELVDLLIRYGVDVNRRDRDGDSALILAAEDAPAEIVRKLIEAGAEVNAANKLGQTALMNAAYMDDIESVRALLTAGANAAVKNKDGETAWDLTDDEEIEMLLVTYGATPGKAKERPSKTDAELPAQPMVR